MRPHDDDRGPGNFGAGEPHGEGESGGASPDEVTRWLNAEDARSADAAYAAMYEELRRHARRVLRDQRPFHTLGEEGLLAEAYLKVTRHGKIVWDSRGHFLAVMSRAMRQILIDYEKRRIAAKRGGDLQRVPFTGRLVRFRSRHIDVLTANELMKKLWERDPGLANVLELKYFVELQVSEIAAALNRAKRTVERELTFGRTWLESRFGDGGH